MGLDVMSVIFWSVMSTVFVLLVASGWEEIEEWWWMRGTRREIRLMERESRRNYEREEA